MLLIGAAALLEVAVFAVGRLSRLSPALQHRPNAGDAASGTTDRRRSVFRHHPRAALTLSAQCQPFFLLLFAITSTFLYFQQVAIVSHSFSDRGAQTAFFATIDLAVNCLTLGVQLFLTGRIIVLLGVAVALALLPAMTIVGFGSLAAMPNLTTIAVFQVLRRAGDYAIARPTREVLFTVLPREDRYKTKSFIDTFVYRLGDQVGAWASAALHAFGDNVAAVAMVVRWALAGLWLIERAVALAGAKRRLAHDRLPNLRDGQ